MMWKDPIVEEVRQIRGEIAAKYNYDVYALVKHYQQRQRDNNRQVVTRPPKQITTPLTNATTSTQATDE